MAFIRAVLVLVVLCVALGSSLKLKERFAWKKMHFDWPSQEAELEAIKTGRYIPNNNLPLGVERWQNKLFVTVPRWRAGVASSLNYIDLNTDEKSPKLIPYPSWEANTLPIETSPVEVVQRSGGRTDAAKAEEVGGVLQDNATIISTFRINVDVCDRLWVFDTGLSDILGSPKQIAPNAIVVFDLKTDQLLRRFNIPKSQVKEATFFANIIVDADKNDCDNAYAYVPDLGAYGVVVYSLNDDRSWRVKHNFFHFDPLNGDFNVGGVNFQWTDGVFGMAVGEMKKDATRDVYFHALASTKEFVVSNRVLQNESHALSSDSYYDYTCLGDRGSNGQSTAEVYDKETGVIFYTQVNKDAIGCWNTRKPLNPDTQGLVDSDSSLLVFPNDLKLDAEGNVWVLSDRMPTFIYKQLNYDEVNYRVLTGKNTELIKGTPCEADNEAA